MSIYPKRSGMIRKSLFVLLGVPLLVVTWLVAYFWVGRSSHDLIYKKNSPAQAVATCRG